MNTALIVTFFTLCLIVIWQAERRHKAKQIYLAIVDSRIVPVKDIQWLLTKGLRLLVHTDITGFLWFYARNGSPAELTELLKKVQGRDPRIFSRSYMDDLYDECVQNCQNASDALISLFEQYGTHFTIEETKEAFNRDAKRTMTHFSSTAMEALTDHPYLHAIGQMIAERGWMNRLLQLYKDKLMPQRTAQACLNAIGHDEELYKNHFTELTILMLFADDKEDSQKLMQWLRNEVDKTQNEDARAAMRSSIARLFALQVDKVPRTESIKQ